MVSALWKASSDGNLEIVIELLQTASPVDIEIRDQNGITPLIEATKNGHVEVVKALLDKGADHTFASVQGRPHQYTSDPAILELLTVAQNRMPPNGIDGQDPAYAHDPNVDPSKRYYPVPPAGAYAYYPGMGPMPPMPDGSVGYYQAQPPPIMPGEPGGPGNLPPPEIARLIPCRYFPACRYGSSCIFAHPQGQYYSGSMQQPAQYPSPYDPMAPHNYAPNYYAMPPPPSFPPNGVPHMSPMSPPLAPHQTPHPPLVHARSSSEVVSPVHNFSPPAVPPAGHYGPMSPISPSYPHPGPVPVPLSIPPLPPLHQSQGPQSPQAMYHGVPPSAPPVPFGVRQDVGGQYPGQPVNSHMGFSDVNGGPKSPPLQPQADGFNSGPPHRDGMNHNRRGSTSIRRGSFRGQKPSCLFFPSGRCRNGDECRFPHIMPEGGAAPNPPPFSNNRGSRVRGGPNGNGFGPIEEKMANLAIRDDSSRQNGVDGSSRSHSTDAGSRSRFSQNGKVNGNRSDKRTMLPKQRVPNADDFPVLGGTITPPSKSPGNGSLVNGHSGPTAAQVLSAPAPFRKEGMRDSSTRAASPEQNQSASQEFKSVENNGYHTENSHDVSSPPGKMPISFAAMATGGAEATKEVPVAA